MHILYYTPGQKATMMLETFGSDGYRANCSSLPIVHKIYLPDLSLDGYTVDGYVLPTFSNVDVGLYRLQYTLPKGSASIGSYLIEASYLHPTTQIPRQELFQLICSAPFGNFGLTTG